MGSICPKEDQSDDETQGDTKPIDNNTNPKSSEDDKKTENNKPKSDVDGNVTPPVDETNTKPKEAGSNTDDVKIDIDEAEPVDEPEEAKTGDSSPPKTDSFVCIAIKNKEKNAQKRVYVPNIY